MCTSLRSLLLPAVLVAGLIAPTAHAQVSLTALGSAYTQNFDTLPAVGSATWANNSTLPGWYCVRTGTGTTVVANNGSNSAGNLYSYGTGTATDRALGSVGSGNVAAGNFFHGVRLANNTGTTITSLDVAYVGEQWRNSAAVAQSIAFSYLVGSPGVTGTLVEFQTAGTTVPNLDFTSPITGGSTAALDGNLAANRVAESFTIGGLSIPDGSEIMLRWSDPDQTGADHGLAIDDFSVTPHAGAALPNLTVNDVSLDEGNAGTTSFTFTVSLSAPAGPGGVTFDIATADGSATAGADYVAKSLTGQTIPAGSSTYSFTVLVNGDTTPEPDETFFTNVTNVTGATVSDGQGQGTIVNDDLTRIHDVQGNGTATPIPGASVTIEGVVVADFQGANKLQGFFLEEEDAETDADPNTSEAVFVFCGACTTPVAEGQRVRATGIVSELNSMTEVSAGAVLVTDAGNHLSEVTPAPIALPVVGNLDDFYEAREGMLVTFVDALSVSDAFELPRYGQIVLSQGGRPRQFAEDAPPSVAGFAAHEDDVARRQVILDDDNDAQEAYLNQPDGSQALFYPRANGGFSVGTQGTDFFRGGDIVNGLTGVLQWSSPGFGAPTWRIRPAAAHPAQFTVANPRPATAPAVGGTIKAASMNLLNYFTTLDTTSSSTSGPCGPSGTEDCRGADSVAELNRQRERASIVVCGLNADVYAFMELENTTPTATVSDLLGAVNARCGGAHPYAFANTGGTLGTDAIRVMLIYRTGVLSLVGAPLVDLDPIHNRPPTAQTFDVVDALNPAFGRRFTVIANHFRSKGCDAGATGADADALDGQSCYAAQRTAQAARLLSWINATVLPAAGDPDVLLLGDFNAYARETSTTTIEAGGFSDLESVFLGANAYSYLFDAQLGHIDYAFASTSLAGQVTGAAPWHINADEASVFDYNDEISDTGESAFEEKPDGSALVPPRVVFQPASPYRASDHDPVIVGLFPVADLSVTNVDTPDPVSAGSALVYTITVSNNGPDAAASASLVDTLPPGTTFISLDAAPGWSCTTPAIGAGGTITCSNASVAVGSAPFTLTVAVDASTTEGTVLSNTASATSATAEGNPGDESATANTTVAASADLSLTQVDTPDPVAAGANLTYTITANNAGPSNAASVSLSETLPAGTTFVSLSAPGGWSCVTPAVGAAGTVSCSVASFDLGSAVFTLTVAVDASTADGTLLANSATATSTTPDPNLGNESARGTTTVSTSADLSVTKVDTPDPVVAGANLTYTITASNAGPSNAAGVSLGDTLPAGTTFVSLSAPGGWSCVTPAVGAGGTVSCSATSLGLGSGVFTLIVAVDASTADGTVLSNTATASSTTPDPNPGNESATANTTVGASADLSVTKVATPDPVVAGDNLTYTLTASNAGPSNAAGVSLGDTLPAGTTFVSLSSPGGWSCVTPAVGAGGSVSCTIATMGIGSAPFVLTVAVDVATPGGSVLSNTATVSSSVADPAPANNSATATTSVLAGSTDLAASITLPATAAAGSTVNGTYTCSNNGPIAASNATCAVSGLPAGATTTCTPSVPVASLASGTSIACSMSFVAPDSASVTAIASASSSTSDSNPANDTATATVAITAQADLSATIALPPTATARDTVNGTFACVNNGPSAALDATCAIAGLPAGAIVMCTPTPPVASLAAGAAIDCTVSFAAPAAGTVNASVSAGSTTADPDPADNAVSGSVVVQPGPVTTPIAAPIDARWMLLLLGVVLTLAARAGVVRRR